ncbi:unnamed protein product [Closterium sp. Naga37s-1]|nr:unnamed protein product [Closterium sp. Naga37s-1]
MEGGFRRDGNGELGKEDEGGRGKQWVRKGEKGRVKSRDNKGDMNVQEDEEGEEWDEEEGDEKEEGRSLDEAEEETDGENKQPHVSDDLELVPSHGQARVRRRLAGIHHTSARLADCVPCTSDDDVEKTNLQGLQSGQGGEGDENAGRGNSGLELEGSRKLLQESAPCCDPLVLKLRVQTADLERRMGQIAEKQAESKRVSREKYVLNKKLSRADANWEALFLSNQSMHEAQMTVQRCNGHGIVAQQGTLVWKGYTCDAADEALRQYTTYDASGACPDDWFATQSLIFHHRCFSLPQRRCRARTTNQTINPLPFPQALFNLSALIDTALVWDHHACSSFACLNARVPLPFPQALFNLSALIDTALVWDHHACSSFACLNARVVGDCRLCFNLTLCFSLCPNSFNPAPFSPAVLPPSGFLFPSSFPYPQPLPFPQALFNLSALIDRALVWDHHACSSFACLNARVVGDCRLCFNLTLERNRWRVRYRGSLTIADVLKMKQGSIRLGLDIGGGTGSFAAHMALYNVTILTTAMNVETVVGRKQGLPYMEAIALRGLIPLHLPHKARLPFFDGSLDIIHSVNSVKYLPMLEFEEMLFDWDRVLRVGAVIWLEMFYAPLDEFPVYVTILNLLSYSRLHWRVLSKPPASCAPTLRVLKLTTLPVPSPTLPCPLLPSPALSFPPLPSPSLPCPLLPSPALSFPPLPSPSLPCPLLPSPALSFPPLPSPSLPCPPLPSGGVIWLEMFYAPLDEFPVYVAILNLLSYNRLHWRVLPKPDPGERKGPHVYLNCLLEKPVRREEGWGGAGRRREEGGGEEGRRGEFGGGEAGRRREEAGGEEGRRGAAGGGEEGGRREEVGGEDGVGRAGVKREEGRRKEEGRGEETSSRAEGEVKGGRRSEEARQMEGSRKEGGEEEGKREEWNEAEREPEKSKEGAQVELKSRKGSEREEGRREEAWIEEWGQQEGTSTEQFAREWYREEGGSGEVGVSREGKRRTAEEKAERQRLSARVQERRERKAWWRLFGR